LEKPLRTFDRLRASRFERVLGVSRQPPRYLSKTIGRLCRFSFSCRCLRWVSIVYRLRLSTCAISLLDFNSTDFDLILCNRNHPGYPWREVIDLLAASSPRSCILLVSPTNDDYLCWVVLYHRSFDVLIHPLREEIVLRVIDTAVRCLSPIVSCSSRLTASPDRSRSRQLRA
jgi:hypothetical protein